MSSLFPSFVFVHVVVVVMIAGVAGYKQLVINESWGLWGSTRPPSLDVKTCLMQSKMHQVKKVLVIHRGPCFCSYSEGKVKASEET